MSTAARTLLALALIAGGTAVIAAGVTVVGGALIVVGVFVLPLYSWGHGPGSPVKLPGMRRY
jgi:hypothetical protein